MAEGGTFTFSDPDGYAAAFADIRLNLTITGAGEFRAQLTQLKLNHLDFFQCREELPRIAYITLPQRRMFLSFPVNNVAFSFNGLVLHTGDMILHARGGSLHHRIERKSHWGLISVSPEQLVSHGEILTGRPVVAPDADKILHPARAEAGRLRLLFRQACRLSETRKELIGRPEVARALEQEMLHAIINCLYANEMNGTSKARHQHTAVMARFEDILSKRSDQKLSMPRLCSELGVPERTLRMCCAEFLGLSPTRYILLRRLNRARAALRSADPSMSSVAEVARNHQFLELGRFAVTYRTTFGESPSATLQRGPQTSSQFAESA
jgi:AraC-like DNA-binding protein